jgi:hypothetical protein
MGKLQGGPIKMSQFGFWGPGSKQEIAFVNLVPRDIFIGQ